MARSRAATASRRFLPESLARFLRRSGIRAFGLATIGVGIGVGVALATHVPGDPSWKIGRAHV